MIHVFAIISKHAPTIYVGMQKETDRETYRRLAMGCAVVKKILGSTALTNLSIAHGRTPRHANCAPLKEDRSAVDLSAIIIAEHRKLSN